MEIESKTARRHEITSGPNEDEFAKDFFKGGFCRRKKFVIDGVERELYVIAAEMSGTTTGSESDDDDFYWCFTVRMSAGQYATITGITLNAHDLSRRYVKFFYSFKSRKGSWKEHDERKRGFYKWLPGSETTD